MELKRKYREILSPKDYGFEVKVKENNSFKRILFPLTGWYYYVSKNMEKVYGGLHLLV
jgi:uncharacterized protein YpbB